jgi:hypothetical protein
VFIWKHEASEIFLALATDDCMVLCDDISQFLDPKSKMEAIFEVTLQNGAILRFLNLGIIQSPSGISIDQTDHIFETIVDTFYKDRDTPIFLSITSPFQMDASFEQRLYEAPVLTGSALRAIEDKFGGSLFHWYGVPLHVALTTHRDIGYAIMRITGYLTAPNEVIFEGLVHTMCYIYF